VLGSGLAGSSRGRVFACFGEPRNVSSDTWLYARTSCTTPPVRGTAQNVVNEVRLYFEGDVVERVTHERTIEDRECVLGSTTY
jgi:hypothetical protein